MFEVRCSIPFNDNFIDYDDKVENTIGQSHWAGSNGCKRDYGWEVSDFEKAMEIKNGLLSIFWDCNVNIREKISYIP